MPYRTDSPRRAPASLLLALLVCTATACEQDPPTPEAAADRTTPVQATPRDVPAPDVSASPPEPASEPTHGPAHEPPVQPDEPADHGTQALVQPTTRADALARLEDACTAGIDTACADLRHARMAGSASGKATLGATAAESCTERDLQGCRAACERGDARSCTHLGAIFIRGTQTGADHPHAFELLTRACDDGDGDLSGCAWLVSMYINRQVASPDHRRGVALAERLCRTGHACHGLALIHELGRGVPADLGRAAEIYRRACAMGEAGSCHNLGLMHARGRGVAEDRARARTLLSKACAGGVERACGHLRDLRAAP